MLDKIPRLQTIFPGFDSWPDSLDRGRSLNLGLLQRLFRRVVENLAEVALVCFIDALDECPEDQVREMVEFLEELGESAANAGTDFRICLSSRHYPHITVNRSLQIILEDQEGHSSDISRYLASKLKAGQGKQWEQIKSEILTKAAGVFLWVVLVVQILNRESDQGRVQELRNRLRKLPADLYLLFEDTLTRDGEHLSELLLCIPWLLFAERPLNRKEFHFAILAGESNSPAVQWNREEWTVVDMERFILSCSKGLAGITSVKNTKAKNTRVQFIHESVREFFLKEKGFSKLCPDITGNFEGISHERLKRCCYRYLSVDLHKHLSPGEVLPKPTSEEGTRLRDTIASDFPFLFYALRHVLLHADTASKHGIAQDDFIRTFDSVTWVRADNALCRSLIHRHTEEVQAPYLLAEMNCPNLIS